MIDLIAIDLDGTLLSDERQVSQENLAAIQYAHEQGVKVVLCTGRPYLAMNHFVEEIGLTQDDDYIITFNGSLLQQAKDGKILAQNTLTHQDLMAWKQEFDRLKLPMDVVDQQYVYYPPAYPENQNSIYVTDISVAPSLEIDFQKFDHNHAFNKFVVAIREEYLDQQLVNLNQQFAANYSVVKSHPFLLEIMSKGTHKARAIQQLAEKLHIDASRIMGIGDQENDLSMIDWVGIGVAMGNAVNSVKAVADYITASNNHHGVAKAIYKYIK